jgi:hypothetical protein
VIIYSLEQSLVPKLKASSEDTGQTSEVSLWSLAVYAR